MLTKALSKYYSLSYSIDRPAAGTSPHFEGAVWRVADSGLRKTAAVSAAAAASLELRPAVPAGLLPGPISITPGASG